MRWLDFLLGLGAWHAYLAAFWYTMIRGTTGGSGKYCHDPRRCPLKHRLVLIVPPHKPMRFALQHLKGQ